MPFKHSLLLEHRTNKTDNPKKAEIRLRISQTGRGNLSFTHPSITTPIAKVLKPFLMVLKQDYSKLASIYQKDMFAAGLTKREILVHEDDDAPFSVISIARHTGAYSGVGQLQSSDWVTLVVPEAISATDALVNIKLILRLLQTFLTDYHE